MKATGIDGAKCAIVGDHELAGCTGTVMGYEEDINGKWGLVIGLDGQSGKTCTVFDSDFLQWEKEQ